MQVPIASIRIKFNRFPTPKNNRIENKISDIEATKPRRELAKMSENVKRNEIKSSRKNSGIAPKV